MGTALPTTPDYSTALPESGGMTAFGGLAIGTIFIILGIFLFFVFIVAITTIIFQGIGIMKMHEKLGLKNGWMAFVPVLNQYALGRVAEQYIKPDGRKSARFSVILLVGGLINVACSTISGFLSGFSSAAGGVLAVPAETLMIISVIVMIFSLFQMAVSIVYCVLTYVALWRVYAIFNNQSSTLFLILSIFIGIIQPFLIFAIRNNEPCCVEIKEETPIIEEAVEM